MLTGENEAEKPELSSVRHAGGLRFEVVYACLEVTGCSSLAAFVMRLEGTLKPRFRFLPNLIVSRWEC